MATIRLDLPNAWRADEAKATARGAASLLAHSAQMGIKNEATTLLRSELRAFAQRSLVGRPGNTFLSDMENDQLRNLVVNIVRQTTRDAAEAGKPQPRVALLQSLLAKVNRREQGFAGSFGAFDPNFAFGPPVNIRIL